MSNSTESPRTLVMERVFPHPPTKLWRALTESPLLAQWMMSNDFEPVVGRKFQFRADPMPNWNGIVDGEVLVIDPLQRLSYSWGVGGSEGVGGLQWVVLWTLTPAEGGTHVRMEQSGFGPEQQANYQGAKYGWQKFFDGLERVLDGGAV
ncbi:SRPBCC family protein [Edaphobacter dinghuensis]|uniref:Activator of HSP90 ATPase n=1 Tax=Edaphobacter dinghuensis TaxID=1560005 RepID=A0A917M1W2_9BACT|nr:SRPBCC domain-containing protein [Edaphobacter dinghuensis]GGG72130.1 activator of HSP90 ATPase [Edaphobacter dinghuensis]